MSPQIAELIRKIETMEDELEAELAKQRAMLRIELEHGKVRFEQELLRRHRELQIRLTKYILGARPLVVITAPIIYSVVLPVLLLDLFVTVYQSICFRVYGIARVSRSDYFVFDRAHLPYLNLIEKLNCAYCTYANGVVAYVREVASRTEEYWCPIKHARRVIVSHKRYVKFEDYGDAQAYRSYLERHRQALKAEGKDHSND